MIKNPLPEGFSVLTQIASELIIDLKYQTHDNIVGRPLRGYHSEGLAVLSHTAALSLKKIVAALQTAAVKQTLKIDNPKLIIFDSYRPQMASDDFWEWGQSECNLNKAAYYPNVNKKQMFELGYIARKSSHSRGSTVDLTLADERAGKLHLVNMGTAFDFMDELSAPANSAIGEEAFFNRQFLQQLMHDYGWQGYDKEWWHFTLTDEPFPDTYFNFPLTKYE